MLVKRASIMSHQVLFIILVVCILSPKRVQSENSEDSWVEPNAWSRNAAPTGTWKLNNVIQSKQMQINRDCICREEALEEQVALTYFKKFIKNLLNPKKLKYDKHADLYKMLLHISVLPSQLEKLERINDPRDLDILLTEVIGNAHLTNTCMESDGGVGIATDMFNDLLVLLKTREIKFTLISATTILIGWLLQDRYKIGVIRLTIIGMFLFGYYINYLECNRKLENDELIQFMQHDIKGHDTEQVRNSLKIKMPFCRPDHVLMIYANELLFKQFELSFETFLAAMYRLSDNLPWPIDRIVPLLTPFLMLYLVCLVFELVFKYVINPRSWVDFRARRHSMEYRNQSNEDRISGENLRLFLKTMKASSILNNGSQNPTSLSNVQTAPASGVEEISEQKEDLLEHSLKPNSNSSSLNTLKNGTNKIALPLQAVQNGVKQCEKTTHSSLQTENETTNL